MPRVANMSDLPKTRLRDGSQVVVARARFVAAHFESPLSFVVVENAPAREWWRAELARHAAADAKFEEFAYDEALRPMLIKIVLEEP